MGNNKKRPIYLNLFQIRLPIGGVASILHRVTGALLALMFPFALYLLQGSLQDPAVFSNIAAQLNTFTGRFGFLIIVWIFAQHFFSGVRHLLLDIGIGDGKASARLSAWFSFLASGLVVLLIGICL